MWYADAEFYIVNASLLAAGLSWLLSLLVPLRVLLLLVLVIVCLGGGVFLGIETTARHHIEILPPQQMSAISSMSN